MPATASTAATPTDKFSLDKSTVKGITLFTMRGTIDHAFEGRKVGNSVSTKKVVVNMRDVRRLASWGMSEWMDFLRLNATRDVYLVECSTYAVSQLNLVTGLLGSAKLVSFYASYRCVSCQSEEQHLFLIPRDREQIRDLPNSTQDCRSCGGLSRLEEYPAAFFDAISNRPVFDIDDEVLNYLRNQYKYDLQPDTTRFRAHRKVDKDFTYIRLSGALATMPGETIANAANGTTVVDLKDVVFEPIPSQVEPWRAFIKAVGPKVKSLQLVDTPPFFLQSAVISDDLHDKVKVRTLQLVYDCSRCHTRTVSVVDVAENLEELSAGAAPATRCAGCKAPTTPTLTMEETNRLRALPARERDPLLDKFLAKSRLEPADKLEDCLLLAPATVVKPKGTGGIYAAIAASTVVVAGLVVFFFLYLKREQAGIPAGGSIATGQVPVTSSVGTNQGSEAKSERPEWVVLDVPASGYCHDMINRLMCVGVSSFRPNRDEAVNEANEVALEELVSAVGIKISEPYFKERVVTGYSDLRSKALSNLQSTMMDRGGSAYTTASEQVSKTRKRVVEILRASGGPAVPAQRSDWYWEEYQLKTGPGTEFLVFVRFDVTIDAVRALVEKYSTQTDLMGSTAMTAFPAVAWQHADFAGGALITKAKGTLAETGVVDNDLITALADQRVSDVPGLVRRIEDWKQAEGDLQLKVKTGTAAPRAVVVPRAKVR